MATYCGAWSLTSEDPDGVRHVIPLRCRSWGCPTCARLNRRRILRRLEGADATSFLTLTCNPMRWPNPDAAFHGMSHALDTLVKRLRRLPGVTHFEYFLVWERTRRGWPHCHLLLRASLIPVALISNAWDELTSAPIVDIRRVHDPREVVAYIAKYLAKDPAAPPRCKRFRCSRAFFGPIIHSSEHQPASRSHWTLVRATPKEVALSWQHEGLTLQPHSDGTYQAFPGGHPGVPPYPSPSLNALTPALAIQAPLPPCPSQSPSGSGPSSYSSAASATPSTT